MKFLEALALLKEGKMITDGEIIICLSYDVLCDENGNIGGMFGFYLKNNQNNWKEYIKPELKLHTFEEAITALKNGKVIYRKDDSKYAYVAYNNQLFYYSFEEPNCLEICNVFYPDIMKDDWIIEEPQREVQ